MTKQTIRFPGSTGAELAGTLHSPSAAPYSGVLICHCFTCSRHYKIVTHLANLLAEEGHAVLRFDFMGLGDSSGAFEDTTLGSNIEDIAAASRWMETRGFPVKVLIGHSMGGVAALLSAKKLDSLKALAVLATPSKSDHLKELLPQTTVERALAKGKAVLQIGPQQVTIRRHFLEDLKAHSLQGAVQDLAASILVLHGTSDRVVPIQEGEKLFEMAKQPKAFVALSGADHLFGSKADSARAGDVLTAWLRTLSTQAP